jgi:hypothetical protein
MAMPEDGRKMYDTYLTCAREDESDQYAHDNLERAIGVLGYALSVDDLTAGEHDHEWTMIKLIRAQRVQARKDQEQAQ